MSKCRKVKNPCKICLRPVTRKTGLQCEGACESWVHYECLNYTPGKIQDIKRKVIRVSCPCPDCKSTLPKEHRADEPYTCTNPKCPANHPARCRNKECPLGYIPDEKSGCSLSQCGTSCKQNVSLTRKDPRITNSEVFQTKEGKDACTGSCSSSRSSTRDIPGDHPAGIEDMCVAVGQLTCQITDLMNKMKMVLECSQGRKPQFQPCHCPGNPCRK
ncbi:uncharacterized protein LOC121737558 [Aricia agestis]|uniref:uncharacterized protein LOC121737558 n=1 Tax=Aricia agestis TaxID=91739 RepID=UPI001C207373|nr:uncharacterized protein LOC121737558 [Aricia agestis]